MQTLNLTISPEVAADATKIQKAVAHELRLPAGAFCEWRIVRKSVDARQRALKVLLTIQAFTDPEEAQVPRYEAPVYKDVHEAERQVVIVGSGPAGLFAALQLLEAGIRPVLLERGKDVSSRKVDIALLNRNEGLNGESNYCFGEGGAGTFSDGKLFSRSKKRGNMQRVMEIFHYHGAADSVLYDTHAHIGSDRLPAIIRHMRETIIQQGGKVLFGKCVTGLILTAEKDGAHRRILGVRTSDGEEYRGEAVILGIGHSAHDTYHMLQTNGVTLESKGFAMGVRVEHPQALIDRLMYHGRVHDDILPAAAYSLVTQVSLPDAEGLPVSRGVYSFCMCPGGHIVPAGSEDKGCVVNGMSASHRNSPYANSGIVVEIHPQDVPNGDTLAYQELVERLAREGAMATGTSAKAPAQRLRDFVEGRPSKDLPSCSYLPGIVPSRLDQWLPAFIGKRLQQGFRDFDRKYPGFLTNDAVILGVESRSSSAVRIPRDKETLQHIGVEGLYPAGEGAGYAGGITSSALDGINAAIAISNKA